MICELCRFYTAYTIDRAADELDMDQIAMMLEQAKKRPYSYVVMVEPKKGAR